MPLVTTIIARVLAISDYYLAQWVDVTPVANASPNGCWSFDVQNATLNACGQENIGGNVPWGMINAWQSVMDILPSVIGTLATAFPSVPTEPTPP